MISSGKQVSLEILTAGEMFRDDASNAVLGNVSGKRGGRGEC